MQKFRSLLLITIISLSYPYIVKKVLFCDQILKIEILMNLSVLKSLESECRIFRLRVKFFECVRVCFSVCYQHNSKNKVRQKPQIWHCTFASRVEATCNFLQRSDIKSEYRETQSNSNTIGLMYRISR